MIRSTLIALVFLAGIAVPSVRAQDTDNCVEHPFIRPFPGSTIRPGCDYKDFDEYTFRVTNPATGRVERTTVQGKSWSLHYTLFDAGGNWDRSHSVVEYKENYKRAALERGGKILFEDDSFVTFSISGDDGSTTWCEMQITNGSNQILHIIEVAPMVQSMTFGPAEMKAALDAEGRVQLHGILFDLDKSTLQPESTEQLQHVVTLLKNYPELKLEVQGHTDDQGDENYNLDLSRRRAATVVVYLTLFGIDGERLSPAGYGESQPVASNATEEGRAQNRRVELVRK